MQKESLLIKKEGPVTTLTLNRPEVCNAFNAQLIDDLLSALNEIDKDPKCRVLVLNANGKHFSAGADLEWMRNMKHYSKADNIADAKQLAKLMQILYQMTKPTIAVVKGKTLGGGIGLIACCDIAVASPDATFCFSEVKLGLIPAVISTYVDCPVLGFALLGDNGDALAVRVEVSMLEVSFRYFSHSLPRSPLGGRRGYQPRRPGKG